MSSLESAQKTTQTPPSFTINDINTCMQKIKELAETAKKNKKRILFVFDSDEVLVSNNSHFPKFPDESKSKKIDFWKNEKHVFFQLTSDFLKTKESWNNLIKGLQESGAKVIVLTSSPWIGDAMINFKHKLLCETFKLEFDELINDGSYYSYDPQNPNSLTLKELVYVDPIKPSPQAMQIYMDTCDMKYDPIRSLLNGVNLPPQNIIHYPVFCFKKGIISCGATPKGYALKYFLEEYYRKKPLFDPKKPHFDQIVFIDNNLDNIQNMRAFFPECQTIYFTGVDIASVIEKIRHNPTLIQYALHTIAHLLSTTPLLVSELLIQLQKAQQNQLKQLRNQQLSIKRNASIDNAPNRKMAR